MATKIFNYRKFYNALNRARKSRGSIAWNRVATRAGVTASNMHVFVKQFEDSTSNSRPKELSLETVVKLLDWMNQTDLAPYLVDEDDVDVTT